MGKTKQVGYPIGGGYTARMRGSSYTRTLCVCNPSAVGGKTVCHFLIKWTLDVRTFDMKIGRWDQPTDQPTNRSRTTAGARNRGMLGPTAKSDRWWKD